jgi:nucleotide-binding universal stress UspA family protein
MLTFRKILFPVDFSERCRGAAKYVNALAARFNAEVILLHVRELPMEYYGSFEDAIDEELQNRLAHFVQAEMEGRNIERIFLHGNAAAKILETAEQRQADLIVMPSHGYGPFRRFILGSVTAKVLHDSPIPVWTGVHMEEESSTEPYQISNVVCAIDLQGQEKRILEWASKVATEYDARLTIVHVIPSAESRPGMYFNCELNLALLDSAREQIAQLLDQVAIKADTCVHAGEVAKVVREAAERHRADLLLIGRAEPSIIGRLRTEAYAITRESPCPVLSV